MAQGKKYNDDIKEKAFALLACNNSVAYVAKELKLPYSTVKTWEKKFLKQSDELARQEKERANVSQNNEDEIQNNEHNLAKLRNDKKKEFVDNAWELIGKCETLMERRLSRAVDHEKAIDRLFEEILELDDKELSIPQRKILAEKIMQLKMANVKEIAVILGTLYDKQALANKEATAIVDNNITIKFEDL